MKGKDAKKPAKKQKNKLSDILTSQGSKDLRPTDANGMEFAPEALKPTERLKDEIEGTDSVSFNPRRNTESALTMSKKPSNMIKQAS